MNVTDNTGRAASISFRQLRLFKAIGDLKSVRNAAEHCNLSQPAVTQALAKLEEGIGVTLVDRRASGSYLNEHGKIFHARTERFFDQMRAAVIACGTDTPPSLAHAVVNRLTRSQVRTLLDTIKHGSFKRASEEIGVCLSSLQRAARDLESNLNASLFYRSAAGVLVSPTGFHLGRRMRLALQEIEWGIDELDAARGTMGHPIVIGAMPFGGTLLLASVLDDFLRLHPAADIRIINDNAPAVLKSLSEGSVDMVIGLLPEQLDSEISGLKLVSTPYSVVVNRGHPLTNKGKVTLGDLMDYDWIVGTAGSSRRACFDQMFAGGTGPKARIATCALTLLDYLLKHSDRLSLMTSFELQHGDDALRALPFGPILPSPSIGIMTRRSWMPTSLHSDFIDIVRAEATRTAPPLRKAG